MMFTTRPGTTTTRLQLAILAVGFGSCLALTGCGADSDGDAKPAADAQSETATEETTEAPAEETAGGGAQVTIDGEAVELDDDTVVCQEAGGTVNIAVGSLSGTDGIGAVLTTGDAPEVMSVALGSVDGTSLGWTEGAPGEVSATKNGSTYSIEGSTMAVDMSDPTAAGETPFTMDITCP